MPPPALPPTPSSSTDIKGKDGTRDLPPLQMSFELPPPALASPPTEARSRASKPGFPVPPSETAKSRRRPSASAREARDFELPPPPTRSRKIIQMKPPMEEDEGEETPAEKTKASGGKAQAAAGGGGGAAGKKKQPSATSAAGKKIARKTAHSLIERRRRSKMNEEFAVLKGMIPACTGEMHKLAILQASIEYVRYLEDCVTKLQAQRHEDHSPTTPTAPESFVPSHQTDPDETQDVEMTNSAAPSPTFTAPSPHSPFSPALNAEDARRESQSSASTDPRRYSYTTSATASPAFGPQYGATLPPIGAALGSPALGPRRDADREATAALLMLNTDRRGFGEGREDERRGSARGMSVRDLLSA